VSNAHVSLSVEVAAPQSEVFEYFTAWTRQNEWMLGTEVHITNPELDPHGRAVGSEIAAFTGIGFLGFWDPMRITVFEAPFRVDVVHLGRVVRGTGTMLVESTSATTSRFVWSEDLELPLGAFGAFGFAILKPFFLLGVKQSLNKFARQFQK
jgi:hypothetical protein